MLNLLFISDNPRAKYIKSILQPVLKVIVDITTDFDSGLKDVFEKRPGTVCIQDKIGGVTGESVARHIQMLLGKDAPRFILLYAGIDRPKEIKGLYEYSVDLSQSDNALSENIIAALKSLLGVQWERVYIPPKAVPAVPEEVPNEVDKLMDEFLSDLETSGLAAVDNQPPVAATPDVISKEAALFSPPQHDKVPELSRNKNVLKALLPPPATPAAADFRIKHNTLAVEEHIPEDLLLEFDANYRSQSLFLRPSVVITLVMILLAAGGWYVLKYKLQLVAPLKQLFTTEIANKQIPLVPAVQKPIADPVPKPVIAPSLPSFIPKDGRDSSFAAKNPGWERYVGKLNDFRVFSASGRIQAVQVLALKDASISESLIKSVLQEFIGSAEYKINSRNTKVGIRVEKGSIDNKGEVVIYSKNEAVKAFVVSVN